MASENGQEKRETLEDIAAEIRAYGDRPPPKRAWLDIAERIEAIDSADAWRSPYSPGNAAAMREALEYVLQFDTSDDAAMTDGLTDAERIMELASHIDECQKRARAALSEPPRQCDVGTAEEQSERFRAFCKKGKLPQFAESAYCAYECACRESADCKFAWAQTPYAAEEGGES